MKKVLFISRMIVSAVVIVAALVQLTGLHPKAIYIAVPMVGLLNILQGIDEWKEHRAVAILGFCAAGFIFVAAIFVFFIG